MGRGSGAGGGAGGRTRAAPAYQPIIVGGQTRSDVIQFGAPRAFVTREYHRETFTDDASGQTFRLTVMVETDRTPSSALQGRPVNSQKAYVVVRAKSSSHGEMLPRATAELRVGKDGTLYPNHVVVQDIYQRRGIASRMYKAAERVTGNKIVPSKDQTPEGRAFSAAFRGRRS